MSKTKIGEGDWFAIPLEGGGYSAGLIARWNSGGVLLGYFFGPRMREIPTLTQLKSHHPEDAVLIARFGDLGLIRGDWPVLGRIDSSWHRSDWPMPGFINHRELIGKTFRVFYDEDDPSESVREEVLTSGPAIGEPADGMMGAKAVEIVLDHKLS